MKVINRKIDDDIYGELENATTSWNSGVPITTTHLNFITAARTVLANNFAMENMPWAFITPAFYGQLMAYRQFTSVDYVSIKGFENVPRSKAFTWYGINWVVDAGLPGSGTAAASQYMFAQEAIGHACDVMNMNTAVGYDEKNDKSWARCSTFMGSKLLQDAGVIKIPHDDTAALPTITF